MRSERIALQALLCFGLFIIIVSIPGARGENSSNSRHSKSTNSEASASTQSCNARLTPKMIERLDDIKRISDQAQLELINEDVASKQMDALVKRIMRERRDQLLRDVEEMEKMQHADFEKGKLSPSQVESLGVLADVLEIDIEAAWARLNPRVQRHGSSSRSRSGQLANETRRRNRESLKQSIYNAIDRVIAPLDVALRGMAFVQDQERQKNRDLGILRQALENPNLKISDLSKQEQSFLKQQAYNFFTNEGLADSFIAGDKATEAELQTLQRHYFEWHKTQAAQGRDAYRILKNNGVKIEADQGWDLTRLDLSKIERADGKELNDALKMYFPEFNSPEIVTSLLDKERKEPLSIAGHFFMRRGYGNGSDPYVHSSSSYHKAVQTQLRFFKQGAEDFNEGLSETGWKDSMGGRLQSAPNALAWWGNVLSPGRPFNENHNDFESPATVKRNAASRTMHNARNHLFNNLGFRPPNEWDESKGTAPNPIAPFDESLVNLNRDEHQALQRTVSEINWKMGEVIVAPLTAIPVLGWAGRAATVGRVGMLGRVGMTTYQAGSSGARIAAGVGVGLGFTAADIGVSSMIASHKDNTNFLCEVGRQSLEKGLTGIALSGLFAPLAGGAKGSLGLVTRGLANRGTAYAVPKVARARADLREDKTIENATTGIAAEMGLPGLNGSGIEGYQYYLASEAAAAANAADNKSQAEAHKAKAEVYLQNTHAYASSTVASSPFSGVASGEQGFSNGQAALVSLRKKYGSEDGAKLWSSIVTLYSKNNTLSSEERDRATLNLAAIMNKLEGVQMSDATEREKILANLGTRDGNELIFLSELDAPVLTRALEGPQLSEAYRQLREVYFDPVTGRQLPIKVAVRMLSPLDAPSLEELKKVLSEAQLETNAARARNPSGIGIDKAEIVAKVIARTDPKLNAAQTEALLRSFGQ